ncbi:MAG: YcaO-like family protein [Magnetococcales bacterium]|nr:YcaO-like family protein [Magnetococcales bacterium]
MPMRMGLVNPDDPAVQTVVFSKPLISARIGLIASCRERRAYPDGYHIRNWLTVTGNRWARYAAPEKIYGGGSLDWTAAYASAIGEAVERTSLSYYDHRDLFVARFDLVDRAFCERESFLFYLDAQYADPGFPFRKPDFSQPIAWVKGWSLTEQKAVHVPASLVYMPYQPRPGEPLFTDSVSVGTSCARSPNTAAVLAILELVERDAWTMVWETRACVPEISPGDIEQIPVVMMAMGHGLHIRVFDLTNDTGIPSFLAICLSDDSLPSLAIGTAARLNPRDAIECAISEAITSWRSTSYLCMDGVVDLDAKTLQNRRRTDFSLQSLYYANPDNRHHFDFLLRQNSPHVRIEHLSFLESEGRDLERIKTIMMATGHRVVLFDLTQRDAELVGLYVVRAVSTSLMRQPLGLLRPLAHPRLFTFFRERGLVDEGVRPEDLLQSFHPFP